MAPARVVPWSWTSLLLLAALTAPAAAQQPVLSQVVPPAGTLGTEVLIEGSGFGSGSVPKVWLEFAADDPAAEPAKHRMRVLQWSDVAIRALVLSGEAGPCELVVKVKPQDPVATAFEILMPQVSGFAPSSASPGDFVVASGSSFGKKRGRVVLFDRPCRVTAWADDAVTFRVPGNVADGEWTPRVSNAIGEAAASSALVLSGSAAGLPAPFVKMHVDGAPFVAQDGDVVASDLGSKLAFDAYATADGVDQQLSVIVPFAPATGKVPKLFSGTSAGNTPVFYQQTLVANQPPLTTLYVVQPSSQPWKVHILARSQDQLFGQLSAVLVRVSGPGPDMLVIEDGSFLVAP